MKTTLKALIAGTATVLAATFAGGAMAATPWQQEHAHRAEIQRHHQDPRIDHGRRTGPVGHANYISPRQARQMHWQERHRHGHHGDYRY